MTRTHRLNDSYLSVISTDVFMYLCQFVYHREVVFAGFDPEPNCTIVQTNGTTVFPYLTHCCLRKTGGTVETIDHPVYARRKTHTCINGGLCWVAPVSNWIYFTHGSATERIGTGSDTTILLYYHTLLYIINRKRIDVMDCEFNMRIIMRTTTFDETISDATLLETGEVLLLLNNEKIRFLYSGFEIRVRARSITASSDRIFALGDDSLHTFLYDCTPVATSLPHLDDPICAISANFCNTTIYLHTSKYTYKCRTL